MWLSGGLLSPSSENKTTIRIQNHKMNNQSILVSIQKSVSQIRWATPLQQQKAVLLCKSIFNLYTKNGCRFNEYMSLSKNYFTTILPSKRDYIIKQILVDNKILESDNSYSVAKGIGKGYRFSKDCLRQDNISSTVMTFTFSNSQSTMSYLCPHTESKTETTIAEGRLNDLNNSRQVTGVTISYLCPHTTSQYYQAYYHSLLNRLSFDDDTDELITSISSITPDSLITNQSITDQYIYINHEKAKYRYTREKAISLALQTGNDLIKFKDKFYVDQPEHFIENKSRQLKITYCQSVFNIKNGLFYCDRNDTNNRLDYNLTGFKKELFTKLKFDGERLTELDIANAQFAIAAHLNPQIDDTFICHAEAGTLYNYIEKEMKLPEGEGKALMFRIAFDKVRAISEFENMRTLFPEFMRWVDTYKQEHGYKLFSNLLQKKEAEIMIDGLLPHLIDSGYDVFTIHDALRVKEPQTKDIYEIACNYFTRIGFKCVLRVR